MVAAQQEMETQIARGDSFTKPRAMATFEVRPMCGQNKYKQCRQFEPSTCSLTPEVVPMRSYGRELH